MHVRPGLSFTPATVAPQGNAPVVASQSRSDVRMPSGYRRRTLAQTSALPAPARFMFEPSGIHSMHLPVPVPMPVGDTDFDRRMLPASSPGVSLVGKLPPALS